ncbi:MAG TPA: hypothetical protein VFD67_06015 [Gemmatimonadaceae bacterium]|nr:hypothetical protein [Gemmatimonadaceae bacterium]
MQTKLSTAFRAAVLGSALVAACNDTPVGPRERAPVQGALGLTHTESFSGASADSVLRLLDAGWHDHGAARQARLSWRRAQGVPDSVGDPGLPKPILFQPTADLLGEAGTGVRPAPQVISHYEALHFGRADQYMNVPDGVEAEVTFFGDQADIELANLTIASSSGAQFPASGRIAFGAGQLTYCTDILFGNCDYKHHLNGVITVSSAPVCDARGNGSVSYYVTNLNQSVGFGTTSDGSVSANAPISATAPTCPSADSINSGPTKPGSDSTTQNPTDPSLPTGSPSGPPPAPEGPGIPPLPPSYPPPSTGGTAEFWCQTTRIYTYVDGVRTLFVTVIDCYPA